MQKLSLIPELDALRGITTVAVVLFRYTMHNNDTFSELLHAGSIGIDLFFVLSGYTIFRAAKRVSNGGDFVTARLARIYPAYWFAVTLYVFLQLGFCTVDPSVDLAVQYAANVTMLQRLFGQKNIDAVYWILLVVLMFYAVVLLLIQAKLLKCIDQIASIALPLLFIYGAFGAEHMGTWPVRIHRFATLVEFFPLFLAGILFYQLKAEPPTRKRVWLVAGCYVTQLTLFHLMADRVLLFGIGMYAFLLLLCFAILFVYVYEDLRFFVTATTLYLGTISYEIFLLHSPVDFSVRQLLSSANIELDIWEIVPLNVAIVLLLSTLVHYSIAKPILGFEKSRRQNPVSV